MSELGWRCADGVIEEGRSLVSPVDAYDRKLCRLAFLAPDIQGLILEGRQPLDLTLDRVVNRGVPVCWRKQRACFGIAS